MTIDELRRAYQLLDLPDSASERSIKKAYRRIAKRWHPDRYAIGTPALAEATEMMKLINEAYSQIANAPLRGYDEQTLAPSRQTASDDAHRPPDSHSNNFYANNSHVGDIEIPSERLGWRIGACLRFLAGGMFGVYGLWVFYVSLRVAGHPLLAAVLILVTFLGGGFAMARYGKNIRWGRW